VFSGPEGTCATVVFSCGQGPPVAAPELKRRPCLKRNASGSALGAGRAAIMLAT
jgi:hypothetical protein